ncbi:MAG: substrate-binding domain-containing protein [Capsulimonadaceae bacterium]|nr:substrate-binding domain-containing protein [Capsulimonadaceae bacterium]
MATTDALAASNNQRRNRLSGIVDVLRTEISNHTLKPGDRLYSYSEARTAFGVVQGTWDRVISVLEGEGLVERRSRSGVYVVDRAQAAWQIGFLMLRGMDGKNGTIKAPYWSHLLGGMYDAAAEHKVALRLIPAEDPPGVAGIDGLLFVSDRGTPLLPTPQIRASVALIQPVPGVASVFTADEDGVELLAQHLLYLGHRRIGYLIAWHLSTGENRISGRRYEAYADVLTKAGISPAPQWKWEISDLDRPELGYVPRGRDAMRAWLQNGFRETGVTAILCQNDEAAIGAIEALAEVGIRVPEDVSVAGFDGTEAGLYFTPRLTSVSLPLDRIGYRAMELLLAQLEAGCASNVQEKFSVQLLVRASTGAAPLVALR